MSTRFPKIDRNFDKNYTPQSRRPLTFSERDSPENNSEAKSVKMADGDEYDVFSAEKGYPGFCAGFARELTDRMSQKLVPEFSEQAGKLINNALLPIKRDISTVNQKVDGAIAEVCVLRSKVIYNKTLAQEAKDLAIKLDAKSRMNNLIFSGVPETLNEKSSECLNKIFEEICKIEGIHEDEVNIQRCYRIGEKNAFRPRDIMVQFLDYNYKQAVSRGREVLSESVKVRQDLPVELAYMNRALMPIKSVAEKMSKYKFKVFVSLGELKFRLPDGKELVITLKNLDDVSADVNYVVNTFKANDRLYCYFSVLNVLSNFRFAPIRINGFIFEQNEKYIQYRKAAQCNDEMSCIKIMESDNPYEIKKLGHTVKGFVEENWLEIHTEVGLTCNRAKFHVHEAMGDFLVNTHPRRLAEASKEDPRGCGLTLSNDDILDQNKWHRTGTMGEVLMKIRGELIQARKEASSRVCRPNRTSPVSNQ